MINQFSANYDPNEDRVLFRFNTTDLNEFRLWLSRKVVLQIIEVLPQGTEQGTEIQESLKKQTEVNQLKGSARAKQAPEKIKKPKFIEGKEFPVGQDPILAIGFKAELAGAAYRCSFHLKIKKTVNINITPDMMLNVHSLLNVMSQKAKWLNVVDEEKLPLPARALH